jgi:hypothetical protein
MSTTTSRPSTGSSAVRADGPPSETKPVSHAASICAQTHRHRSRLRRRGGIRFPSSRVPARVRGHGPPRWDVAMTSPRTTARPHHAAIGPRCIVTSPKPTGSQTGVSRCASVSRTDPLTAHSPHPLSILCGPFRAAFADVRSGGQAEACAGSSRVSLVARSATQTARPRAAPGRRREQYASRGDAPSSQCRVAWNAHARGSVRTSAIEVCPLPRRAAGPLTAA